MKKALLIAGLLACAGAHAAVHQLDDGSQAALLPADKTYDNGLVAVTDRVFRDGLNREVVLRGWNISGKAKHVESGFKPFLDSNDARAALTALRASSGSNVVRFLLAWEGANPAPDRLDTAYLDAVAEQMRIAIGLGMYVLIDYHQDLYARRLFNADSWHTGNGAPDWIITGGDYPAEYCGPVCTSWAQHNITDEAVRRAARNFWNNAPVRTPVGTRYVQDSFLWQLDQGLRYLRGRLSAREFSFVVGVDPWNEPVDGGMEGLTPAQWDNQKLWPFYRRVRAVMDGNGWAGKPVFAEPLVFWNTNAGIVAATGGHHLTDIPARGFVFNSHYYDAGRMGGLNSTAVNNGSYFAALHQVRDEARYLRMPAFLSEFGTALNATGARDTNRMIAGMYQGTETSDALKPARDRFADAYSPPVSATQWHWNWYYDRNHELQNGNPQKLLVAKDAWNDEDFSAIRRDGNDAPAYNLDARNIERVYPRAAQGEIMAFHYNARARDATGQALDWLALRPVIGNREYFRNNRWALLVWRGRNSDAPTELFLPREFNGEQLAVITDKAVVEAPLLRAQPDQAGNEVLLAPDNAGAYRLLVWDDPDADEGAGSWHYALVVHREGAALPGAAALATLKQELDRTIVQGKLSPVYFTGAMTAGGYAADAPPQPLQVQGGDFWSWWQHYAWVKWSGATGDVDILENGSRIGTGSASGERSWLPYASGRTYRVCERGGRRCSATWTVP